MRRLATQLMLLLSASLIACGGKATSAPETRPPPSDAEDYCATGDFLRDKRHPVDPFAEFCTTQGSNPELENRMTDTIIGAGAAASRFSVRCRGDICSVKCVTVPREQCVEELHTVGRWSAPKQIFDAIGFQDRRGQAVFKFVSKAYLEALPARRELVARIASRLRESSALKACKASATAHGLLLLHVEVPTDGTPSVTVRSEIAETSDADCVSKALLAVVIDERVPPPFSTRDLPIAVKL